MFRRGCNGANRCCLCTLVSSLGCWRGCRWWPEIFSSLSSCVCFFRDLFKVQFAAFNKTEVLVLDHGVRLSTHVICYCDPVRAKMCNVLVKVLQLRN